jgi:7,8-dihydropterin-6-yl-methyl-4-(beta-D-ribofuranosyl)aminobenzene 5'-phosphate synthase
MPVNNSGTNLRIVILVDNQAVNGFKSEHGLSLWIDTGTEKIVFDTGHSSAFAHNARRLRIDLSNADRLVLSHGHYDHTGGMALLLTQSAKIHVYCHPGIVQPRYGIHSGIARPIDMPSASRKALDHVSEQRLHWVLKPEMLSAYVGLSGPIPRTSVYEDTGGAFYLDPLGRRPDAIEDDLALWVITPKGLVVCVGCCHAGLVNTLQHILRLNPGQKIHTVIGGFHLLNADADRLRQTIIALRAMSPERIVACHCTGESSAAALQDSLGKKVILGAAGKEYVIYVG